MKQPLHFFKRQFSAVLLLIAITLALNSCFLKQDRTTVVYGTNTDENGQPVDSIMVLAQGAKNFKYADISHDYSDINGEYEITVDVPKIYSSVTVIVPPVPFENPKFMEKYKSVTISKNGKSGGTCYFADIGKKTRYDFQLISK